MKRECKCMMLFFVISGCGSSSQHSELPEKGVVENSQGVPEVSPELSTENSVVSTSAVTGLPSHSPTLTLSSTVPVIEPSTSPRGASVPTTDHITVLPKAPAQSGADSVNSSISSANSSASSTGSSVPSFMRHAQKEPESNELPWDFADRSSSITTSRFGTGRFSRVDFAGAEVFSSSLDIFKRRFNLRWKPCSLKGPLHLIGTDNEYSVSAIRNDVFLSLFKGHAIEKDLAGDSRIHKVTVKVASRSPSGTPFDHVWRELAVLSILQNTETVPTLFRVTGIPQDCQDQVVITSYYGYRKLSELWTGRVLPWQDLVKLAIRGISMLESIHNRGIVHGNIGWDSVVFRPRETIDEIVKTMRLIDFEFSKVWVNAVDMRSLTETQIEPDDVYLPLSSWSAYRVNSNSPRSLRDDLLGFMECIMMLGRTGPIDFTTSVDGMNVAMLKRQFAITEAMGVVGGGLYRVFSLIYRLDFTSAPDYSGYIAILNGSV